MTRRKLALALTGSVLLLVVSTGAVSAECGIQPTPYPRPQFAFVATVSEVSDRVAPGLPDASKFNWHVTMDVERGYVGAVPKQVEANGWDAGCNFSGAGGRLAEGERVFIASENLDLDDPRLILGTVLIWRDIGGGHWEFYGDAMQDGTLGYPSAAIQATTTEEILAVIGSFGTPDTSTAPTASGHARDFPFSLIFAAAFVGTVGILVRRARRDDRSAGK